MEVKMSYKYWLGQRLLCESTDKVKFTKDFPAVREEFVKDVVEQKITTKKIKTEEEPVNINKEN
jgi:hypothetical protein